MQLPPVHFLHQVSLELWYYSIHQYGVSHSNWVFLWSFMLLGSADLPTCWIMTVKELSLSSDHIPNYLCLIRYGYSNLLW